MTIDKAIKYRVKCPHCGSKIEFELREITFSNSPTNCIGYISCPHCNRTIQTHDGYWIKSEYSLLKSVEVIHESEDVTTNLKLFGDDIGLRPPEEMNEDLIKLFEKEEDKDED